MLTDQLVTLALPRRLVLNSNHRKHYHEQRRIVDELRRRGAAEARETLQPMDAAQLLVVAHYPDRRRRDTPNLWPTVKALVDGIVADAGMLPDDDDEHLQSITFARGDACDKDSAVVLDLHFRDLTVVRPEPTEDEVRNAIHDVTCHDQCEPQVMVLATRQARAVMALYEHTESA